MLRCLVYLSHCIISRMYIGSRYTHNCNSYIRKQGGGTEWLSRLRRRLRRAPALVRYLDRGWHFSSGASHGVWRTSSAIPHPGMADTYGCPLENLPKTTYTCLHLTVPFPHSLKNHPMA